MSQRLVQTLVGVYGFYDKELTEFAIRIWADAMAEFDLPEVEKALQRHLKDPDCGRWLPKPADVIRQLRGDADEQARLAWADALEFVRGGGFGLLNGPAKEAVNAMGGLSVIGRADESQNGFLERRFVDFYKAYKRRGESPALGVDNVLRIAK